MKKTTFIFLLCLVTMNGFATSDYETKIKKAACIPLKLAIVGTCLVALQIGTDICLDYNRALKGLPLLDPIDFNQKLSRLIYSEFGPTARLLSLWSVFPLVGGVIYYGQSACQDVAELFDNNQ